MDELVVMKGSSSPGTHQILKPPNQLLATCVLTESEIIIQYRLKTFLMPNLSFNISFQDKVNDLATTYIMLYLLADLSPYL